jgi:uncharacterized repeat protein (TIGR03803 family)
VLPAFCAQAGMVLTSLYSFQVIPNGANPYAGLVQGSDGNLYGTTEAGGTNGGNGTVFKISANGELTSLYSFTGGNDGGDPYAGLVEGSDGNFYGTTYEGGTNDNGTVFKIGANGELTSLYSFTGGNDGASPYAGLVEGSDGNFYGTTYEGGTNDAGTVFKISADGALTSLYSFIGTNDGANPEAGLAQGSDGSFYGTTYDGGTNGAGAVFKISTGGALTSLYSFSGGNDGANPQAGLALGSDGNFYGTTSEGGTNDDGAVFKIGASGALTSLYSFTGGDDGANPYAGLVQGSDGNFYSTTYDGGTNGSGTVFKISAKGALTSLYSFTSGNDGGYPADGLVQGSGGSFYGTTQYAGANGYGNGTVFKISANGALSNLYSFTGILDGANPDAALVQGSDGKFYGTTFGGGTNEAGTVFKISTNGALTSLYSFTGFIDGAYPQAGLVDGSDGNLHGTTTGGGTNGNGTVFQISTDGALTTLYSFTGGNDGGDPEAGLVQGNDGSFYGTTYDDGTNGFGTVFKISTNVELTSLYSFSSGSDGANPDAGLVQGSDGNFYGTTEDGGTSGSIFASGTVFKISTNGELAILYPFTGGNDGANPQAGLVQGNDGNLYGTTYWGGTNQSGTVFQISTKGALTSLYSFTGGNDGANPQAVLVQGSDGDFYGTTVSGGTDGYGTVFKIGANGGLTSLYSFTGANDGGDPEAGLVQGSDGSLYGTTEYGGQGGNGTVFRLTAMRLAPAFQAETLTKGTLSLTWTTEAGGMYQLQYNSNLSSSNWINLGSLFTATGATLNTTDSVTNGPQRFYRVVLLP